MRPLDRMPLLPLAILALLAVIPTASSAVFSLDLGSEWMKVAVVDVKPGQSPIRIALNEMSKRKSPSVVAFSGGNRLLAEEAIALTARFPERVYSRLRDMVGKPLDSVKEVGKSSYLPYDFVDVNGAVNFRVDGGDLYTSEELLGMILGYCKGLAESSIKSPVKDAVITVPPYFGQAERRAVIAAAQAAGINVLSLINEHAAAALQYGIDKDFSTEPKHVLFYDAGASNAYAAVVHFSSYTLKQGGKNISHNYFELKGIRWDAGFGGQTLEIRLAEHFAREFQKQTGVDVREFPKAFAKLKKEAKRTKEILSANTEAHFFVDSLHDDRDFRSHITRQAFEELCGDLWHRAVAPVSKVLEDLGMSAEQLDAVELLGGATRVPKLQQALATAIGGKKPLERHLDADEAITLGAALHAANISDGIKLNRKLGMVDGLTYGIVMKIDGSEEFEVVAPRLKRVPLKLARGIKKQEDFGVGFLYDPEGEVPPGIREREISAFRITGVTEAASKYSSFNLSAPIKAVLHFGLARSGQFSLERAETVVEVTEWVEVAKNSSSGVGNSTSNESEVVSGNSTEAEKQPEEPEPEKKLRRRTIRVPAKIEVIRDPGAYPEEEINRFQSRLEKLKLIDDEKRQTEEAKNNLESYIYTTKEMVESIQELSKVSSEKEREGFITQLTEAGEWLYSDGESASASDFKKRLRELKEIGDPIFYRLEQMNARPASVEGARVALSEAEGVIGGWKSDKPWISDSGVRKEIDEFAKWLEGKQSEQKKLTGFDQPAFSSGEVYSRVEKLKLLVTRIGKTPKPKVEKLVINETGAQEEIGEEDGTSGASGASESDPATGETSEESGEELNEQEQVRDEL